MVPNSRAFFAAIAVITFIASWNAFLWPLIIGQDASMWTVQVALSTFLTAQTINLHELFLAAAVSIAPLVLAFVFLQRYLVQGVAETGIKGWPSSWFHSPGGTLSWLCDPAPRYVSTTVMEDVPV